MASRIIFGGLMKTTLLDFPGKVAATVFLPGCNMRCPFCHNASLVNGACDGVPYEDVLAFLRKRAGILDGVCITGGEPTLYGERLTELIKEIKELGYLVKLDTNGTHPELVEKLIDSSLIDYVAMDVKSSPAGYPKATGVPISATLFEESMRLLQSSGIPHEFRTTAVKGLHLVSDFEKIGVWISGAKRYFIQQFIDSGDLIKNGFEAFNAEETEKLLAAVRGNVPAASARGI
jgi:pyruvate formate lyase activating enzyme